jgi:hypothetical protein
MAKVKGTKYTKKKNDKAVHPPVHPMPMQGATNMQTPGSDNESHHPNGHQLATNSTMGPC